MRGAFEVWRRRLLVWAVPFAFCLANALVLGLYTSSLAGGVKSLEARIERETEQAAQLKQERAEIEAFLDRVERSRMGIEGLYEERFATEAERFTRALEETRRLARQAGLDPSTFSYPDEVLEGYGLIKRNINFSVQGTYDELRRFINFLELSDQFLTLERVLLSEQSSDPRNPRLSIRLTLSTVFKTDRAPVEPAARPAT